MTRKSSLGMALLLAACAASDVGPTAVCDARVTKHQVSVLSQDRVDILLVLDASPSMVEARRHLLEVQWPRAIQLLLRGETDDGTLWLDPIGSLRVGVISSDLGAGAEGAVEGCSPLGAEARLLNGESCHASKPSFVWHYDGAHDRAASEQALRCLADIGSESCSVTQPLAAAQRALSRPDADGGLTRNTALVVVVILTDRDDCSLGGSLAFGPGEQLSAAEAALRCVRDPAALWAVRSYVDSLRAPQPDYGWQVLPVIIAGVPPEWPAAVRKLRDGHVDHEQLIGAYDALLADPRLAPGAVSCTSPTASATAPVRLVQFARAYGEEAYLHSICDYDLAGAFHEIMSQKRGGLESSTCLRFPLHQNGRGFVPCRVIWELPPTADAEEPLTPVRCDERPGLLTQPGPSSLQRSARGRVLCEVRQAPLAPGPDGELVPQGEGFYARVNLDPIECGFGRGSRIEFTERARPPNGVTVRLECTDDTQREPVLGSVAAIGDACGLPGTLTGTDALCANTDGDHGPGHLLCRPQTNRCVLACDADTQCPTDWLCQSAAGLDVRVCVKPGCE